MDHRLLPVLAVLIGILLTTQGALAHNAAEARVVSTLVDIRNLQTQTATLSGHIGYVPEPEDWPEILLRPQDNDVEKWRGPYLRKIPLDPWGRPYRYRRTSDPDQPPLERFSIHSVGPDGIDDNGARDDISSWSGFDRAYHRDRSYWHMMPILVVVASVLLGVILHLVGGRVGSDRILPRLLNVSPLLILALAYLFAVLAFTLHEAVFFVSLVFFVGAIVYSVLGILRRRVVESILSLLLLAATVTLVVPVTID